MILLRSFLTGHIRNKRKLESFDAGLGPHVPFDLFTTYTPSLQANFLTSTTLPAWLDYSATTGNRMVTDSTGKLTFAPNNMLLNSDTLSTQTITVTVGATNILSFYGTGSITMSGGSTATLAGTGVNDRVYTTVTPTTTSITLTVTGTVTNAQFERVTYQTTPRTYISTGATAYYGPRFSYDGATLAQNGLLIEGSAVNSALYSNTFSNAYWTKARAAVAGSAGIAPDGTNTAFTLTEDSTATNTHAFFRTAFSFTSGTTYAMSIYAKKNTRTQIALNVNAPIFASGGAATAYFDLNAGTPGFKTANATTSTITDVGNGWYRCSMTFTATLTASANPGYYMSVSENIFYSGNGTSNIYVWGAQIEVNNFTSSYIPTGASTTTRVADIVKITGAGLAALQASAGTYIEEINLRGNSGLTQYGVYGNAVSPVYFDSLFGVNATDGTNVLPYAATAVANVTGRAGLAWDSSGRSASWNGSGGATDANTLGSVGATVYLGSDNGSNAVNGWVRLISFYDTRLPNNILSVKTIVGSA